MLPFLIGKERKSLSVNQSTNTRGQSAPETLATRTLARVTLAFGTLAPETLATGTLTTRTLAIETPGVHFSFYVLPS